MCGLMWMRVRVGACVSLFGCVCACVGACVGVCGCVFGPCVSMLPCGCVGACLWVCMCGLV